MPEPDRHDALASRLAPVLRAIDLAEAHTGCRSIVDAVDYACDQLGIPLDRDRRVVRRAVMRRWLNKKRVA